MPKGLSIHFLYINFFDIRMKEVAARHFISTEYGISLVTNRETMQGTRVPCIQNSIQRIPNSPK